MSREGCGAEHRLLCALRQIPSLCCFETGWKPVGEAAPLCPSGCSCGLDRARTGAAQSFVGLMASENSLCHSAPAQKSRPVWESHRSPRAWQCLGIGSRMRKPPGPLEAQPRVAGPCDITPWRILYKITNGADELSRLGGTWALPSLGSILSPGDQKGALSDSWGQFSPQAAED